MSANTSAGRLVGIGQIAVPVRDLEESVAFYRDQLGLKFLFSAPPGLAFFEVGGVRLMLAKPEPGDIPGTITLYYKTVGLEVTFAAFRDAGVPLVDDPHRIAKMPDHELWMFFARDPAGNLVGVMEEKRA